MTSEQTLIEYDPEDPARPFEDETDEDTSDTDFAPAVVSDASQVQTAAVRTSHSPDLGSSSVDAFRALWGVASQIANTEFVPQPLRGKTDKVFATIIQGRALGVDAMTSLREIWISPQGSPELSAELQAGLVRKAGHMISGEATMDGATLTGKRRDTHEEMTVTFTLADAEAQGLVQIKDGKPYARSSGGKPLPWERHTQSMLWHRAMTLLVRRLFPDVLIGDVE